VVAYAYVLINSRPPVNVSGSPIVGDYIAFHAAGKIVASGEGAHLYDHALVATTESELLQGTIPDFYDAFRNPPFVALVFAPLALTSLLSGFAVWSVLSLGCLGTAIWLLLKEVPCLRSRWAQLALVVFAFAPVYFGLIDGENATVSLLLYVLIYRAIVHDQGGPAGFWAALGLFKPQLFLVFPIVFLVRRSWRALLSYGLTALCLGVVSIAVAGIDGVHALLRIVLEAEPGNATTNAWRMASLRSFFDGILPGQSVAALGLYLLADLVLLGVLAAIWTRPSTSRQLAWIVTSLVAVLVDPHLVDYDLTVLVPAGIFSALLVPGLRWWVVLLYPMLILRAQVPIGASILQLAVPVLAWCTYLMLRALRQNSRLPGLTAGPASARDSVVLRST
jgi:Glycosyltransferase family 87